MQSTIVCYHQVMKRSYLVVSPNNYGNIGDDICAYGGKALIETVDPAATVIIANPPVKPGLVAECDYVILSGGGIIYDRAEKNLENYMDFIEEAERQNKKSAVLGVGVQGIVTDEGRARYAHTLNKCEFVSVRTKEDVKLLDEAGFKNAQATFDIAFSVPQLLESMPLKWKQQRRRKKVLATTGRPRIGICLINLKMLKRDNYPNSVFERFDMVMESFIRDARGKFDVYLIQHAGEDGKLMKALAKKHGATFVPYKTIDDAPVTYDLIKSLDLMIGVRLHSIALGVMAGVPTIAIGSSGAKQKRLIDYAIPSMKKQFFTFNDVDKLETELQDIISSQKITQKPISPNDAKGIQKHNAKNKQLLKELLAPEHRSA